MNRFHPTLLAAAVTAAAPGIQADTLTAPQMEETVVIGQMSRYSALKSDIPILETARSVSIESHQQILDKGAQVLDDTFTYSSGVTGETYGFATRGDWVKVRGLNVPQYQDSLQSLFGNYNNTRPDVFTLEQVEMLKGPASVLYGQGSPGGIINVVSKRPRSESRHQLVVEAGNHDRAQLGIDSTGALSDDGRWLYRLVSLYRDAGSQVDHVDQDSVVVAPSLTWQPSAASSVTMLLNYTENDSDTAAQFLPISGTLEAAANGLRIDSETYLGDPGFNQYQAETLSLTLLADHRFNDTWSGEVTARYTDATADYRQAWPAFIGGDRFVYNSDGSLYKDGTVPRSWYRSDASSEQAAFDGRLRANFATGNIDHRLLMGIQYQDVTTDDDGYYAYALGYAFEPGQPSAPPGDRYWINVFDPVYGEIPPPQYLDSLYTDEPSANSKDIGLYVSDHLQVANWHLTAGLRYDETESDAGSGAQEDDAFSFSAGLLYEFDSGIAPYLSYAESFEPVLGDNGNGQPLDPEQGEQWEVGIKYQPTDFPALVTLAWFDLEQSNLPDPTGLPGSYEQQRGTATVTGLELEAQLSWRDFALELNASRLETESADGYQLASVPEDQASAWLGWRPSGVLQGFRAGLGVRYMGESYGGTDTIKTPSYTLADLMLGYQYRQWDVSLNVRNITDKDYYATCLSRGDCFPGDERTVLARLAYTF